MVLTIEQKREKRRIYMREYRKKNPTKWKEWYIKNHSELLKKYRMSHKKARETAFNTLGKKCSICGYDKFDCCLDIHHSFANREITNIWNINIIKRELEKKELVVLCANCHRAVECHKIDEQGRPFIIYVLNENNKIIGTKTYEEFLLEKS